ncbi:UPF0496 protein 2 [Canna indica]|uniref:UPF0496 protein 2 n=1 Tax=Canna indica TaxID=4628 RepID=A0AAQ3KTV0_9LILI|nr:UPF0496 protein 2 [Canna indica]
MWGKLMPSSSSDSKLLAAGDQEFPMARRNSSHSPSPLNVNEEYNKTLRTKSFLDMCSKVRLQRRRSISSVAAAADNDDLVNSQDDYDDDDTKHPELLLEPSQEFLTAASAAINDGDVGIRVHALLLEYFDFTSQAFTACTKLLSSINGARTRHRTFRNLLIELSSSSCFDGCNRAEFDQLASLIELDNPLCPQNLATFYSLQSKYGLLLQHLTRAHRRTLRRMRLIKVTKKATGVITITTCTIAMVAAVVISVHTVVGIGVVAAAAPLVVASGPLAAARWMKAAPRARYLERVAAPVDAAAKGVYIVGRDFDTMSRLLQRVHDEVEHEQCVARMVVGEWERQLAREVGIGAAAVEEHLQELEEHVCLCLITINRSRRMVAEEMVRGCGGASAVGRKWHD